MPHDGARAGLRRRWPRGLDPYLLNAARL